MQSTDNDQDKPDWVTENLPRILKGVGAAALFLALASIGSYVWRFHDVPVAADTGAWGELGDFFGGVLNPAFSFLALVGLLMTLYVQSRELKLSRQMAELSRRELEMTREELKNSAEALAAQNEAINHQRFEQTFFAWLESYRSLVAGLSLRDHQDPSPVTLRGVDALRRVYELHFDAGRTLEALKRRAVVRGDALNLLTEREEVAFVEMFMRKRRAFFETGSMYAQVSTLVELVGWITEQKRLTGPERRKYVAILRSQLSVTEQHLLLVASLGCEWPHLASYIDIWDLLDGKQLRTDQLASFLFEKRNDLLSIPEPAEPVPDHA